MTWNALRYSAPVSGTQSVNLVPNNTYKYRHLPWMHVRTGPEV